MLLYAHSLLAHLTRHQIAQVSNFVYRFPPYSAYNPIYTPHTDPDRGFMQCLIGLIILGPHEQWASHSMVGRELVTWWRQAITSQLSTQTSPELTNHTHPQCWARQFHREKSLVDTNSVRGSCTMLGLIEPRLPLLPPKPALPLPASLSTAG